MRPCTPFELRAEDYARARPTYPPALFETLARLAPGDRCALDVGAGSGQAAGGLGGFFRRVLAIDSSRRQLAGASPSANVSYAVAAAEAAPLPAHSVELLTVAAAIHWFDLDRFYGEVRRVLVPGGLIAVFSYFATSAPGRLQEVIDRFADEVVGPFWDERIALPRNHYRDLDFPFDELSLDRLGRFEARHRFSFDRLVAFMRSWSASQAFERQHGADPVSLVHDDLLAAWGDPAATRELRWPLFARCGRV